MNQEFPYVIAAITVPSNWCHRVPPLLRSLQFCSRCDKSHCKENESEKGSPKSAFRALETASFAVEGRDKREQWILFADEHGPDHRQEVARPIEGLRQNDEETDTFAASDIASSRRASRVATVKQISAGAAVNKFFTIRRHMAGTEFQNIGASYLRSTVRAHAYMYVLQSGEMTRLSFLQSLYSDVLSGTSGRFASSISGDTESFGMVSEHVIPAWLPQDKHLKPRPVQLARLGAISRPSRCIVGRDARIALWLCTGKTMGSQRRLRRKGRVYDTHTEPDDPKSLIFLYTSYESSNSRKIDTRSSQWQSLTGGESSHTNQRAPLETFPLRSPRPLLLPPRDSPGSYLPLLNATSVRRRVRAVDVLTSRCFLVSRQTNQSPISLSFALPATKIDNPSIICRLSMKEINDHASVGRHTARVSGAGILVRGARTSSHTRAAHSHERTRGPSKASAGCLWGCFRTGSVLLRAAWGMYAAHPYPHAVSEVHPRRACEGDVSTAMIREWHERCFSKDMHGGHVSTRSDTWLRTPGGPSAVMHRVVKRGYILIRSRTDATRPANIVGGCEKKVSARKAKALIARCGRLDEPIRHDMTDQFTSSALSHDIISRPQFRYLPIFSAEFTRVSSDGETSRGDRRKRSRAFPIHKGRVPKAAKNRRLRWD
ncbi:hypothetical protein DBV15_05219 [Temnothorax longispinosus]|uniref:Uncharacterized protein n=1 Tax=Temnothorax longispinosus TaxID=300112 RepID=A0A4S2KLJ1_9HYME|nr:hypothetical protein DBV15_05219 [Temnothorax longispinosus]